MFLTFILLYFVLISKCYLLYWSFMFACNKYTLLLFMSGSCEETMIINLITSITSVFSHTKLFHPANNNWRLSLIFLSDFPTVRRQLSDMGDVKVEIWRLWKYFQCFKVLFSSARIFCGRLLSWAEGRRSDCGLQSSQVNLSSFSWLRCTTSCVSELRALRRWSWSRRRSPSRWRRGCRTRSGCWGRRRAASCWRDRPRNCGGSDSSSLLPW